MFSKKLSLLFLAFIVSICACKSQYFNKQYNHRNFQSLLKNGMTYIPSGDKEKDIKIISSFSKIITECDFNVYDGKTAISPEQIVLTELEYGPINSSNKEPSLILIEAKYLLKENKRIFGGKAFIYNKIDVYLPVAIMFLDGFDKKNEKTSSIFADQIASSFNQIIKIMKEEKITKQNQKISNKVAISINTNSEDVKNKPLIVLDYRKRNVRFKALEKRGIKYKVMTSEEFNNLSKEQKSKYNLLFLSVFNCIDLSIIDLETNKIIFKRYSQNTDYRYLGSKYLKEMLVK